MRRLPALNLPPPAVISLAPPLALSPTAISLGAFQRFKSFAASYTAAGICALLATTLAVLTWLDGKQDQLELASLADQTIAFRHAEQSYGRVEQMEASLEEEASEELVPLNYPRAVATVRFVNIGAPQDIVTKRERVSQGRLDARTHVVTDNFTYRAEGLASWYGPDFHGRRTANGERYDMNGISAANKTMPLPSYARVTNLDNGRSIIVRVNNRGPYVHRRIVDLSVGSAKALDFYKKGTTRVRVEYVGRAPIAGSDDQMLLATLRTGTPAPAPANVVVASASSSGKELRSPAAH
jgi:rare lipoprotein A (peptidoglycan hydrolase)